MRREETERREVMERRAETQRREEAERREVTERRELTSFLGGRATELSDCKSRIKLISGGVCD